MAGLASCIFARDLTRRGAFFFGLSRVPLFAVDAGFAFFRADVFRLFDGLERVLSENFRDAVFLGRAGLLGLFVFFFFMLALRAIFLAAILCAPSAANVRKGARKLMKRPPPGKHAWGENVQCH